MAVRLSELDLLVPDVPSWIRRSTDNLIRTREILMSRPGSAFAALHLPRIDAELERRGVTFGYQAGRHAAAACGQPSRKE